MSLPTRVMTFSPTTAEARFDLPDPPDAGDHRAGRPAAPTEKPICHADRIWARPVMPMPLSNSCDPDSTRGPARRLLHHALSGGSGKDSGALSIRFVARADEEPRLRFAPSGIHWRSFHPTSSALPVGKGNLRFLEGQVPLVLQTGAQARITGGGQASRDFVGHVNQIQKSVVLGSAVTTRLPDHLSWFCARTWPNEAHDPVPVIIVRELLEGAGRLRES